MELIIIESRKQEWMWREPASRKVFGPFMSRYEAREDAEYYADKQRKLQHRQIEVAE